MNAPGIVGAAVRLGGKDKEQAKAGRRRPVQLLAQHGKDLGRPEELVLQVDKVLRGAQAAQVGLEDSKFSTGKLPVHAVGNRPHDLYLDVSRG